MKLGGVEIVERDEREDRKQRDWNISGYEPEIEELSIDRKAS
jgi:hypothetical protein